MKPQDHVLDEWLVLKYQTGDRKALDLLVKRWHPKLVHWAYQQVWNMEAAKDIAQESWLDITKNLFGLKDPAQFKKWMYRIVRRRCVDWIRVRQRDRKTKSAIGENVEMHDAREDHKESQIKQIRESIQKLPEDQRLILDMMYMRQLSIREIADILSIPVGTVKSKLYYARELLKKQIKKSTS